MIYEKFGHDPRQRSVMFDAAAAEKKPALVALCQSELGAKHAHNDFCSGTAPLRGRVMHAIRHLDP